MAARKQEKHRQMLRRLEAINEKLRKEHAKLVPRKGRVTFMEGELGPCVPSGSSTAEGSVKPSILKGGAANRGRGSAVEAP
eukprot:s12235_g1.t1